MTIKNEIEKLLKQDEMAIKIQKEINQLKTSMMDAKRIFDDITKLIRDEMRPDERRIFIMKNKVITVTKDEIKVQKADIIKEIIT